MLRNGRSQNTEDRARRLTTSNKLAAGLRDLTRLTFLNAILLLNIVCEPHLATLKHPHKKTVLIQSASPSSKLQVGKDKVLAKSWRRRACTGTQCFAIGHWSMRRFTVIQLSMVRARLAACDEGRSESLIRSCTARELCAREINSIKLILTHV